MYGNGLKKNKKLETRTPGATDLLIMYNHPALEVIAIITVLTQTFVVIA